MPRISRLILPVVAFCLLPFCSYAFELPPPEQFHRGLSMQGFTGLLNTPNAHVTEEGYLYALYDNQKENKWRDHIANEDNYLFSVGFFGFAEFGGRFVEAKYQARDLSGNFKLTSEPFFRKYPYIPVLAVGWQDMGGGANFFNSKYAVISEDLWRFRFSAGYQGLGKGLYSTQGKFAGVEFKAHDWVYLLSEYDTSDANVGVRVVTPQFWRIPINFTATAKSSLSHQPGNIDVAVGLNFPLDFKMRKKPAADTDTTSPPAASTPAGSALADSQPPAATAAAQESSPVPALSKSGNLESLRDRLVQAGFINVRVGSNGSGILVVEYENARFNHNELDGVGVVAGLAANLVKERFESIRLILKRHDIQMVSLTMPLRVVNGFMEGSVRPAQFNDSLAISYDATKNDADFVAGDANSGFLKSSLLLYPGLSTWVGTEVAPFDYLLSIKPDLLVNAWKGAVLDVRWDIPVSWSENLNDGKSFRSSRNPARLERFMLFQAIKPSADFMINLGAGQYLPHISGTLNEATWSPANGTHRFRLLQAFVKDTSTQQIDTSYLGSYRYYFAPMDLYLEGTGGRFWAQDKGFVLELKRFFGDAAVSLYYKNAQRTDDRKWEAAGIQFSFPLTPEKDMKHVYGVQVRGNEEWSYAQQTTLTDATHALNDLPSYPLAINPQPMTSLYRAFYNRDRLSEAYIRAHLDRLRDAWLNYGKEL